MRIDRIMEHPQAALEGSVLLLFMQRPRIERNFILSFLLPSHFVIEGNRRLFQLMTRVHSEGLDPTPAVLLNIGRMALDDCQMRGAFLDCVDAVDWWGTLESYARALVRASGPTATRAVDVGIVLPRT